MRLKGRGKPIRRGAHAVEAAVCLALLLPLLVSLFEYCRYVMVRQLAENAAREGARLAVVSTDTLTTSQITSHVTAKMGGQTGHLQGMQISVYRADLTTGNNTGAWTNARFGDGIAVEITGNFHPIGGWMPITIPVRIRSIMSSESN
ncbi:MAG: pilus assembly protein [Gemmatales bacterium]|nr:pilus assembly protein [Gemmatales bacterium]MDW8386493.1 TadE/TadG family type IV pilus assembly protein [Gemmatales bacterium]